MQNVSKYIYRLIIRWIYLEESFSIRCRYERKRTSSTWEANCLASVVDIFANRLKDFTFTLERRQNNHEKLAVNR